MSIKYKKIKVKRWHDVPKEGAYIVEHSNGTKAWRLNGECHRENGHAIEFVSGDKFWYLNGKQYNEKSYWKELYKQGKISQEECFVKCL